MTYITGLKNQGGKDKAGQDKGDYFEFKILQKT